jgi:hypothetical protein
VGGTGAEASEAAGSTAGGAATGPMHASSTGDGEGWELVSRNVPTAKAGSTGELETLDAVRTLVESMSEEGGYLVIWGCIFGSFDECAAWLWKSKESSWLAPSLIAIQ